MAFDMGFNFRGTAGYVTDQSYAVPVLAEAYPHTYTNVDGYSVNGGFTGAATTGADRDSTNEARLAGINFQSNGGPDTFQVDLASGSAPGAGDYSVDLAMGDANITRPQSFKLFDTSTLLIDGTNGGAGITTAEDEYVDATLALVTATTTWTGTPAVKTFATTLVKLTGGIDAIGSVTTMAHFRLTLAGGDVITIQEHIGRGIGRGIFVGR